MTCECTDDCPPKGLLCVPRGDVLSVVVTVRDGSMTGDLLDISGSAEIVFLVADSFGGAVRITKKLSLAEIAISTNLYQFSFDLSQAETETLVNQTNYFECQITSALGKISTVLTGVFKSPNTMIRDLP